MARSCTRFRNVSPDAPATTRRAGWNAAGRGGVALLSLLLAAQVAWSEGDEEPAWIPSLDLAFDYFSYDPDVSVQNYLNPPAQEGIQNNPSNQLAFQLGGELMGPAFEGLPGSPRIFIQGGVGFKPFSSDLMFELGDIGDSAEGAIRSFQIRRDSEIATACEDNLPPSCSTSEPGALSGQGSEVEADFLSPSWYAALGVSFDVPMAKNLLLQVKPSVAYSGEKIDLVGWMTTVTEPTAEVFEVYRSAADVTITDHSLGAGLELALTLFRSARPVRTSIFVDARALWLLSDSTTTFGDSLGMASYVVERDIFSIRGGGGVRFSWTGFAGN